MSVWPAGIYDQSVVILFKLCVAAYVHIMPKCHAWMPCLTKYGAILYTSWVFVVFCVQKSACNVYLVKRKVIMLIKGQFLQVLPVVICVPAECMVLLLVQDPQVNANFSQYNLKQVPCSGPICHWSSPIVAPATVSTYTPEGWLLSGGVSFFLKKEETRTREWQSEGTVLEWRVGMREQKK